MQVVEYFVKDEEDDEVFKSRSRESKINQEVGEEICYRGGVDGDGDEVGDVKPAFGQGLQG
jgi:hypothetical protein